MGSCVSILRGSESAIKLSHSLESTTENLVIIPSPIKNDGPIAGELPINRVSLISHKPLFRSAYSYVDYGSKDEVFFDSQAWLDSDCEDDFLSVNGDFTPSRGNTPVHPQFSIGVNGVEKTHIEDLNRGSMPEPSPTQKKKKLSELFMESFRDNMDDDDQNEKTTQVKPVELDLPSKLNYTTPRVSGANSGCSSERTANGDTLIPKEKPIRSPQCCLPSLVSYRGFGERKKKMSPSVAVNA